MSNQPKHDEPILFSTMKINPDEYSYKTAKNQLESFQYAMAGLFFLFRKQHSIRLLLVVNIWSVTMAVLARVDISAILLIQVAI